MTNKVGRDKRGMPAPHLTLQEQHAALRLQMLGMDNAYLCLFDQIMSCLDEFNKHKVASDPEVIRLQNVVEDFRLGRYGGWKDFIRVCRPAFSAAQAY